MVAAFASLAACAQLHVAPDGTRHVVGFVYMELPSVDVESTGATSVRVVSLGLTLVRTEIGSAINLGYGDITAASVSNNACVPLAALWPASIKPEE
jgi:hypothetical protein